MKELHIGKTRRAVLRSNLRTTQKIVLVALCDYWSRAQPTPFPSETKLAGDTSLSERAVRNAIRQLEEAGVLSISRRKNRNNRYDIRAVRLACLLRPHPDRDEWATEQLQELGEFGSASLPTQGGVGGQGGVG